MLTNRPLSVQAGKDGGIIDTLICVHCEVDDPSIVDVTHNKGVMWKASQHTPIKCDIDPSYPVDYVCDFTSLPFDADSFDVMVFDPPHLPSDGASENASKIWERRYGITEDYNGDLRTGDNVSGLFYPFLLEARRVLKPGGLVLAKIADIIHNHRYQWQHVDMIVTAQSLGMTPCDMIIKARSGGGMTSSKWKNIYHIRRAHSYWIAIRNASYDERKNKTKACIGGDSGAISDSAS